MVVVFMMVTILIIKSSVIDWPTKQKFDTWDRNLGMELMECLPNTCNIQNNLEMGISKQERKD